ncbi:MAG: site-2 protease family protein [Chloroflexi bacterium]|jgi:Zn-dependent protease|nr:site-2 protease family protein [Chloroflexota bacterium]MBT4073141.1 site-2 protease family protein [Chloroflexota bacterium]MBT4515714.1 site-2 protease family protein [Chloroflexota bacterium]MBT5318535.1 site-2 protease family protein [Chloroflexota bacterium]MBT6681225.1 site-2 protease family protein [Chloroflexota bacterium]
MNGAYKIATVAGIDIGVHYTWLFAFALITWTLAGSWFPSDYPDWGEATYWAAAAIAALLLFGSILVHELAHSLVAIARGMSVRSITLFIFGGVSNIGGDTRSARDEFQIAIVGPVSSLLLALAGFLALRAGVGGDDSPVEGILIYFTLANFLVGIFNLLPGFPLDGGRVLRSIIWASTGDNARATGIASGVGIGFGWLLVAAGVLTAITDDVMSGLWMGFVGWYLKDSATAVRRSSKRSITDVPVRAVMSLPERPVHPDVSISALVDEYMIPFERRSVPVVEDDRVVGIITLHDLDGINRNLWGETPVSEGMTGPPLVAVGPDDSLSIAFQLLARYNINQILVIKSDVLVGIIKRSSLLGMVVRERE